MTMQLTRDQTFQVVLNLRTPATGGQERVGTGIFILKDKTEPFILTATHVANECNGSTSVVLSDASSNGQSLSLGLFNNSLAWTHHPVADVSVLRVEPDPPLTAHLVSLSGMVETPRL